MKAKLFTLFISFSIISSTAGALKIQEYLDLLNYHGDLGNIEWLINGEVIVALDKPTAFYNCKEIKNFEGKTVTLKSHEFTHDPYNDVIEIKNNTNRTVKSVSIEFKKRGSSSISYNEEIRHEIVPDGRALIGTNGLPTSSNKYIPYVDGDYDEHFRLPRDVKIDSVKLREMDRIVCHVFYSENELKDIAEKQKIDELELAEKKKIANEVAKKASDRRVQKEKIFNNCIENRLPPTASNEFKISVLRNCDRISDAPNLWNRIRYDYLMQ
jgi:hypothetical protein